MQKNYGIFRYIMEFELANIIDFERKTHNSW